MFLRRGTFKFASLAVVRVVCITLQPPVPLQPRVREHLNFSHMYLPAGAYRWAELPCHVMI